MNIYDYFNSRDIAEHCRKIGHVFSTLDMAVIVANSNKTIREKHEAYREIIAGCPDMAVSERNCFDAQESLHNYLRELIDWEEKTIAEFYTPGEGVVYQAHVRYYDSCRCDHECYRTIPQALAAFNNKWEKADWENGKVTSVDIHKITVDTDTDERYFPYASFNSDGELIYFCEYERRPDPLEMIFIHLPLPFEKGDILEAWGEIFVLDWLPHWGGFGPKYEDRVSGKAEFSDSSDMIGWGLYVGDNGVLYGDHTGMYDSYKYYRGKFTGNERLLHYVSLFMKGGIFLPELLTMQCRILLERQLDDDLPMQSHGCYIPENLLAENRIVEGEKE